MPTSLRSTRAPLRNRYPLRLEFTAKRCRIQASGARVPQLKHEFSPRSAGTSIRSDASTGKREHKGQGKEQHCAKYGNGEPTAYCGRRMGNTSVRWLIHQSVSHRGVAACLQLAPMAARGNQSAPLCPPARRLNTCVYVRVFKHI